MSTILLKTPADRTKNRIWNTLKNLEVLPKVSVNAPVDKSVIFIDHTHEFMPNFKLTWCETKDHYRVYICVASTVSQKVNAGYTICSIKNGLAAIGFCTMYAFLHKYKANQ